MSLNNSDSNTQQSMTPLLCVICVFMILCGLGFWQIQRLQEKQNIISSIQTSLLQPASQYHPSNESSYQHNHKYVLSGNFKYDKSMFLYGAHPRDEGRHGYFVVTPFETEGTHILIKRGWISPVSVEAFLHQQRHIDQSRDQRQITAVLKRIDSDAQHQTHKNDNHRNIWFYIDIPAMSRFTTQELEPDLYMVLLDGEPLPHHLAMSTPTDIIQIENNHLVYAITWFALAIIAVLMYIIYRKSN